MKIKPELVGDFVVLTVTCDGIPEKRISVLAKALHDGTTTLQEQMQLAREDAENRLAIKASVQQMLDEVAK